MVNGLPRYVATVETSKPRTFQFLDAGILPDNLLIAIASKDAVWLGVLSSQVHVEWAQAAGGRLGVGNDPRCYKSRCSHRGAGAEAPTTAHAGATATTQPWLAQTAMNRSSQNTLTPSTTAGRRGARQRADTMSRL